MLRLHSRLVAGMLGCVVLALLLAGSSVSAVNETEAYALGQGPLYHTSKGVFDVLRTLDKKLARNMRIKDTISTRSHQMFQVVNHKAVRKAGGVVDQLPTAVIICNQHAREVITAEVCMWLVRLLAQEIKTLLEWPEFREAIMTGTGPEMLNGRLTEAGLKQWVGKITTKVKVEVVPVVNQEGRTFIQNTGKFAQRKTIRTQVDLNRNWVTNRAQPGSGSNELYRDGEEWQGETALSEWQTRSLYYYMKALPNKALFIDVHSGMWALMCPWGGTFDLSTLPVATVANCQSMFDQMEPAFMDSINPTGIATGPGSGMLYKSEGSSDDTAHAALGFKQVLTVETYAPPSEPDSGYGYSCPAMQQWQQACNEQSRCGDTVCRNKQGVLQRPVTGKSMSEAQADANSIAAYAAKVQTQPRIAQASQLNLASDPFLSKLATGDSPWTFRYFNPDSADMYRFAVARWCAAMLFGLDNLVTNLL